MPVIEKSRQKARYKVDFSEHLAECEANYVRLLKLLPSYKEQNEWNFIVGNERVNGEMKVEVIDRAPYTTTLKIKQTKAVPAWALSWTKLPHITVCLYHDARLAEVVAWNNHRRLRQRYEYPNHNMYHNDEKAQLNKFLRDWLTTCQAQGRSDVQLSSLGINGKS